MATYSETDVPTRRTDEILTLLADRLGARLSVKTVFGDPVERDGVTVVPVAVARFGFGGGGGSGPEEGQGGDGGGGGGTMTAIGHIELRDGRSRFVPVVHPLRMAMLAAATAMAIALIRR